MSEEKRIDRLEGIAIDSQSRIATLERSTDRIEKSIDKLLSEFSALRGDFSDLRNEFSNLRNEFFKMEARLTWKVTTFFSLGGAVAGLLMILFGIGAK